MSGIDPPHLAWILEGLVAGEVRNLAQRSASAAKEIKELIGDSVDKVQSGSTLVGRAGTTMEEIVQAVRRVTDIMGEISAASESRDRPRWRPGRASATTRSLCGYGRRGRPARTASFR